MSEHPKVPYVDPFGTFEVIVQSRETIPERSHPQEAPNESKRRLRRKAMVGLCLRCGSELTFCGKPFSAAIPCRKCLCVNIYEESIRPTRIG